MLQVKDLTILHKKDLRVLTDKLSFVLNPGDKLALIGEEGNGKSTILKWMVSPDLIEDYCEWSGRCSGAEGAGYLAQELTPAEKALTVYEFCAAKAEFFDLTPRELAEIGRQVRFPVEEYYADRPVASLSGGEQIKLQLSRILFRNPQVLLLDEPSSDLDLETLRWLEDFLGGFDGILLFISHDETLIERTANCVLHIEHPLEGKPPRCTFRRLDFAEYTARREAAIAEQTRLARKEQEEYRQKLERYRRIQQSVDYAQATISRQDPAGGRLLKKKMHAVQSMGRRFEREAADMTQMPEVERAIFLSFPEEAKLPAGKTVLDLELPELRAGERLLARNLRLHVQGGEKLGILGANGAGKTTLLKQIAALLLPRNDLRAAYMAQDYAEALPLELSAIDYLSPDGSREAQTRARAYLGSLRYARAEMEHAIRELSGGQKAKLLLTRMALDGINVLLLDEPTRNFSPMSGPQVRAALRDFGGTVIAVSHDRKFLREVCTRLCRLTERGLEPVDRAEV